MLHQLPRLFKQLEFIEPDEACDFGIEILSGKTQGMYHWVSSNLLWLKGSYSHSGYQGHVSVKNDRLVGIIVEVPDKEHSNLLLADFLYFELRHSGSALI